MGPFASLVFDQAGNLYGTTYDDGNNRGSVFKLAPSGDSWVYTDLHDFGGVGNGVSPVCNLTFDANGNLFGITNSGGTSPACSGGCGVVFEITP